MPDDGPGKQAGDGLQVSGAVLDFSSGSEDEEDGRAMKSKMVKPGPVDSSSSGNVASGPGRMSLLQHGFSKLLETVKNKVEGGDGESSSDVEENTSEEKSDNERRETTSSPVCTKSNVDACPSKVGTKTWDLSSSSDTEGTSCKEAERRNKPFLTRQSDDAVRKIHQKQRNPGPSHRCFESYSDESDDLDVETKTKPTNVAVDLRAKVRNIQSARSGSNRGRQNGGAGGKSRCSEDIEMFTSSEEEHTPVKRARPAGRNFISPQNTNIPQKSAERSRAVSLTGPKTPTSLTVRGTIDSVLGWL